MIGQIVDLVLKHNLSPESTPTEIADWYNYAAASGHIEVEVKDKKVIGFMDWVRLERIPVSMDDVRKIFAEQVSEERPVLFAGNCVAEGEGIIYRLRRRIIEKNKDAKIHCFHHKKKDRMVILNKEATNVIP